MCFVPNLVVEDAFENVGLFFRCQEGWCSDIMRVQAIDIFLRPPTGPFLTHKGLLHVEFQGAPGGRSKLVCRFSRYHDRVSPNAHSWMFTSSLHSPLFSHPKVRSLEEQ